MVTLEQVKLLESKVAKAIDFVERVTGENSLLQGKLDSYQKRIDELEVLIQQFREDQGRIEDGILSALDRLNQFEDAIEKSISPDNPAEHHAEGKKTAKPAAPKTSLSEKTVPPETPAEAEDQGSAPIEGELDIPVLFAEDPEDSPDGEDAGAELSLEELPPIDDPVLSPSDSEEETPNGELDIF